MKGLALRICWLQAMNCDERLNNRNILHLTLGLLLIMNRTIRLLLVLAIAAIAIFFIFFPDIFSTEAGSVNTVQTSEERNIPVNGIVARRNTLDNSLKITGSLLPNESVVLKSEVAGVVQKISFTEGQKVKKGQLLLQLDDAEVAAEIEKLEFTKKLNEDIEYRQKQLLAREAISQEEYETALTTLNTTLADIKVRQVQLQKHQIRAPFDGIIGLRSVSEGSYLNPADDIATVYNINPIKLDFSVPGKYSSEVDIGDRILFRIDAMDEDFEGSIYAIEPQIDPRTRSLRIRAKSSNPDNRLLPGQFAEIKLTLDTYEEAIMIPTEAVIPELNGKKVFVLENGSVQNRAVQTGIRTANSIQVTSGIALGDTVITTGILQVRPGMQVDLTLEEL